eukprot:scaffold18719_cov58-Phaeocystis_antarctica.AAC.1
MRSRVSSDLIAGKAARRRRQRGRSGRRSRSRGEADAQRIIINSENRFKSAATSDTGPPSTRDNNRRRGAPRAS